MSKPNIINKPTPGQITLGDVLRMLVNDGLVDKKQAEQLYKDRKMDSSNLHPLVIVGEQKWKSLRPPHKQLTVAALTAWLAQRTGLEYYHIDPLNLDFGSISQMVSKAYAQRLKIMPVKVKNNEAVIATSDPFQNEWVPDLERMLNMKIKLVLANPLDINRYLPEIYSLANSVNLANTAKAGQIVGVQNFEQLVELGKDKNLDANEQHVVNIVDWLFKYAFEQRASDIHLEPKRDMAAIRFRIDGVLHQVYQVPAVVMIAMTARIKLLGRMDVIEKRRPQDGRIKTRTPGGQEIELRLSTLPTAFGEKLVMRIFDPDVIVKTLPELGFPEDDARRWDQLTNRPHGIILVTGPTGSGKTTTLYTTLKALATSEVNVCTVEDPIEMVEASFNQMQVQHGIDLSFADGVRALMRQDPDIIMIGEIRDLETAEMAIQAALTGHLVLSTLHTNDAPSAVMRLLELGVPYYLLEATLIGIMAQRLVRTLCPLCKAPAEVADDIWDSMRENWNLPKPKTVYRPVGCPECRQTGYRGRTGLYELLTVTQSFSQAIKQETDLHALKALAIKDGLKPLRVAGALKVADGVTTPDEVLKVTAALT